MDIGASKHMSCATPEAELAHAWAAQAVGNAASALSAAKDTVIDGKAAPMPTTVPVSSNPGALGTYTGQNPYAQGAGQTFNPNGASSQGNNNAGYGQAAQQQQQQQQQQRGYGNAQAAGTQQGAGYQQGNGQGSGQQGSAQQQGSGQQQGSSIPWGKVLGSAATAAVNAATAGRRLLRE